MGGPCILESGSAAPACTDNFQVAPFKFNGEQWLSCEQCYQVGQLLATDDAARFVRPQIRFGRLASP
jgi:predicted NAD-dependent protein-ADP-ribosyltransferase YbiA (DUF1768 family)